MKFHYDHDFYQDGILLQISWEFENNEDFDKIDVQLRKHEADRDRVFRKLEDEYSVKVDEKFEPKFRSQSKKFREDWMITPLKEETNLDDVSEFLEKSFQ